MGIGGVVFVSVRIAGRRPQLIFHYPRGRACGVRRRVSSPFNNIVRIVPARRRVRINYSVIRGRMRPRRVSALAARRVPPQVYYAFSPPSSKSAVGGPVRPSRRRGRLAARTYTRRVRARTPAAAHHARRRPANGKSRPESRARRPAEKKKPAGRHRGVP